MKRKPPDFWVGWGFVALVIVGGLAMCFVALARSPGGLATLLP